MQNSGTTTFNIIPEKKNEFNIIWLWSNIYIYIYFWIFLINNINLFSIFKIKKISSIYSIINIFCCIK